MRDLIGCTLRVMYQGVKFEGTLVDDTQSLMLLKDKEGLIWRIPKGSVGPFAPVDGEPKKYLPFHVLRCWNKKTACPGVQFIHQAAGVARNDFELFMSPCECRSEDCEYGTKGELRTVDSDYLKEMFSDTLFGDYPDKEKENARSKRTDDEAGDSPRESERTVPEQEQD